jgi:hypothetical protein
MTRPEQRLRRLQYALDGVPLSDEQHADLVGVSRCLTEYWIERFVGLIGAARGSAAAAGDAPASVDAAIEELAQMLDGPHEMGGAFAAALNRCGPVAGDPAPYWRQMAEHLRRGAALAQWLAARTGTTDE